MKDSKELLAEILKVEERVQFKKGKGWYDLRVEHTPNQTTSLGSLSNEQLQTYLDTITDRLNS